MPTAIGVAIASVLFELGAPLVIVNAALSIGAFIVSQAISIGLSLLVGVLLRKQAALPTPSDGQQELKQALSPRVRSYGTVRVGGSVWFLAASGATLYKGVVINHGEIDSFVSYHIDQNRVDIDGTDKVTTSPYSTQSVFLHSRRGVTPETKYSELLTTFALDNMRGDGVATILGVFTNPTGTGSAATFQNTYPGGQPEMRATIKATKCYDPRVAAQSHDDPSTWTWTDNPVLCLMHYLTEVDGYGVPWDDVNRNISQWAACANTCEELVPLSGGLTALRYQVAGSYRLTDDPRDVVAKFESVMDGRCWVRRDGSIGISVGKLPDRNELVQVDDNHVTGLGTFTRGQDPIKAVMGIRAEYMSPAHDYREHEAEPWPDGDTVLALGDDRTAALDLLWVPSNSQARRLMKRAFMRSQAAWHGTLSLDAFGFNLIDERYLRLTYSELNISDVLFEVTRFQMDPAGPTTEVDVIAVDETIDDWTTAEEGTAEGGTLTYVSSFSKSGTTLNPIAEAGGSNSLTAVVLAGGSGTIATTPVGWTLIASQGPTGSVGVVGWYRLLDGTETTTTFNSVAGPIFCVLFSGILVPTVQQAQTTVQVASSAGAPLALTASPTPYATFGMGGANANFSGSVLAYQTNDGNKVVITPDIDLAVQGSFSAEMKMKVYPTDSTPPPEKFFFTSSSVGEWGLIVFQLRDGA